MKTKTTAYIEFRCNGCKHTFMIPETTSLDPSIIVRCPHCLGKRMRPTEKIGLAVTRQQFESAVKQWVSTTEVHHTGPVTLHVDGKVLGTVDDVQITRTKEALTHDHATTDKRGHAHKRRHRESDE